jgi:hypothetical protein
MKCSLLLCALLTVAPAEPTSPSEGVKKYLAHCERAKVAAIAAQQQVVKTLSAAKPVDSQKLQAAQAQLKQLQQSPAALSPLPIPPEKDGVGTFAPPTPGDGRGGRSVDVLEVVDVDDAILRVWYAPAPSSTDKDASPEDPAFLDLWVHGLNTADLKAGKPITLPQVFQVTGSKSFDTACGGRSMTLLEPVDVEAFRSQSPASN